ncbi:MAG: RNA polymerase sigma factor [Vicinamibacterales bacterium]
MPRIDIPPALAERLHAEADAARWQLSVPRFADALAACAQKACGDRPVAPAELGALLSGLHLRDLALATACVDGHAAAWEHCVREQRAGLYRAAEAMRPGRGRDLADSLYGELFGLSPAGQVRPSLFRYFHGRSSLATWLRALMAQRVIDTVRVERRLEPLSEGELAEPKGPTNPQEPLERVRWMRALQHAMTVAIAALAPGDRLRLSLYYAESMTLAQIGRLLGEHEATVSRHLARTRRTIRADVERTLVEQERMSAAELAECLASVSADAGTLDLAALVQPPPERVPDAAADATAALQAERPPGALGTGVAAGPDLGEGGMPAGGRKRARAGRST